VEEKNSYRSSVKKPGDGRPIVRPKHRWEGNIKIGVKVGIIGWEVVGWCPAEDTGRWGALANTVMNLQVPLNGGNFLTSCGTISFSRKGEFAACSWLLNYAVSISDYAVTNGRVINE
jgi:hypothetical protein